MIKELQSLFKKSDSKVGAPEHPVMLGKFDFSERYLKQSTEASDFRVELNHPSWIVLGLFAGTFALAIFYRPFLWLGVAGLVTVAWQYVRLRHLARDLKVSRKVSGHHFNKGESILFTYEIWNRSASHCPAFTLQDFTMYLRRQENFLAGSTSLRPNEKVILSWQGACEAPLGPLPLGPYRLDLQDELGLFHLNLIDNDDHVLQIHLGQNLKGHSDLRNPKASPLVGDLNVSNPGQGLILYGLRDYREGDPLNRVWWKKSLADDVLLVKEFEHDVSRRMSLMVSTEARLHLGYGASSTWEAAKLMALKLIKGYLQAQSTVSLITAENQLVDISGLENFSVFESTMDRLQLKPLDHQHWTIGSASTARKISQEIELIPYHLNPPSLFYLITPYDAEIEARCLKQLRQLRLLGFEPTVIFIDPTGSASQVQIRFGEFSELISRISPNTKEISQRFLAAGIPTYWITAKDQAGQIGVERYG